MARRSVQIAVNDLISEMIAELVDTDYAMNALKRSIVEIRPLDPEDWSKQMVRLSKMLVDCTHRDVLDMECPHSWIDVTFSQLPIDPDNPKASDPYHIQLERYRV